jgi:O-antigen ligase
MPGTRVAMVVLTAVLFALHFCDTDSATRAHPAGWLFLPFLAYAAWNIERVSQVRWVGWTDWLNWAQAAAVFWVVLNGIRAPQCRRILFGVIVCVGVVSAGVAGYQHFVNPKWLMLGRTQLEQYAGRATGSFGIPNSQGVFMALLIPPVAFVALDRASSAARRAAAALALAALAFGFVLAVSRGAWLALATALFLRALLMPGRSMAHRIGGAALALVLTAATVLVLYHTFPIMHVRVAQLVADMGEHSRPIIWRGAWEIFKEHPVFGGGAGCFDFLFEAFRPIGFHDEPVYAHCDYLNTLCDYGLVGFVLVFGAAAVVAWKCSGARGLGGAVFTGLLAFSLHLLVDFHLKIPALAMIVATFSALLASEAWPAEGISASAVAGPGRAFGMVLSALVLFVTLGWAAPKYQAEEIRRAARERIDMMATAGIDVSRERDALTQIRTSMERSVAIDPYNAQAWSDRAYADSLWGLVEPSQTKSLGVQVEGEGKTAIGLSPIVAEFWIREGAGLDMQGKWLEGGECSARALRLAPGRADIWYYQAYHFSLDPIEKGPAIAAADFSLRLDPSFLLAQALRQRLAN